MADSLFASAEAKALLDSGVVDKLSAAAEDKAPLFKITSTGSLAGVQWRRLAQAADLSDPSRRRAVLGAFGGRRRPIPARRAR